MSGAEAATASELQTLKAKDSPDISCIVQIASHPHSGLLGSSSAGTSK